MLVISFFKSQQFKLQGSWILDKITYQNGNSLEINHPLYSNFIEYNIKGDFLNINNLSNQKVSITDSTISNNFRTIIYHFNDNELVTNEKGNDMIYYFLKKKDYLKKYPEFEPIKTIFKNKEVFEANAIVTPDFNYTDNFYNYLSKNIPSYNSTSAINVFFKAKFILTKENKITDIEITEGISKTFDKEFCQALVASEKYFNNNWGKDLLITQTFNFFKIFDGLTNKEEKDIFNFTQKGYDYYEKNDFQNAIANYEKLLTINISPKTKERFEHELNPAFINLGISYLAVGNIANACKSFKIVGDKTNFEVRNYLINFCE